MHPLTDRVMSWAAPLTVTALGGWLRLANLGDPKAFIFDETYYAKDAYSLLLFGYERGVIDGADDKVLAATDPSSLHQ